MTNDTITIETEDGEQFMADVQNVNFEVYMDSKRRAASIAEREYRFEVGTLINVETGEEY